MTLEAIEGLCCTRIFSGVELGLFGGSTEKSMDSSVCHKEHATQYIDRLNVEFEGMETNLA